LNHLILFRATQPFLVTIQGYRRVVFQKLSESFDVCQSYTKPEFEVGTGFGGRWYILILIKKCCHVIGYRLPLEYMYMYVNCYRHWLYGELLSSEICPSRGICIEIFILYVLYTVHILYLSRIPTLSASTFTASCWFCLTLLARRSL